MRDGTESAGASPTPPVLPVPPVAAPRRPGERPEVLLAPRRGWRGLGLHELWRWRELLGALLGRDVRSRYRQTALGALWALLRPLATTAIFAFVLGRLAGIDADGRPYALFTYTGLLAWSFFASAVHTASLSVLSASHLVTKVYFPRVLLPLSAVGAATLDFLVALAVLPLLLGAHDEPLRPTLLLAPLVMGWTALAAAGAGILLAGLVVRARDLAHAMTFLVQVWMYATPVLYPLSLLPAPLRTWAFLNPMAGPVELLRACVLGTPVSAAGCALSAASTLLLLLAGLLVFQRVERRFADDL